MNVTKYTVVNNRPAYNAGRLGNALKGHFSRGTTVPVFTVFMDPSRIEDPAICGKARVFMKTIKALLLLALLSGCITPHMPPLSDFDLSGIDTSPLKGKTVVIDSGHGGAEHGAIGIKGLRESEVNLGVGLYLWGLLQNAGANPVLTRSSDTSVYRSRDFSLKQDLQARADISNSYNTDIFISLHHNSATDNKNRNDLSIFYKMSDPGISRDIAREVCKALESKLKVKTAKIYPGNYHVLRNTNSPAILGEASFISNKKNEGMLSFHRTLRSEAEGYFIGILNYFKKGIPSITSSYPKDVTLQSARPLISARINSGTDNLSIDPSSIKATLDRIEVPYYSFQKDGLVSFLPKFPLQNSMHQFCFSARNRSCNISKNSCSSFIVSLPPSHIKVSPLFPVIPANGMSITPIDIEVIDSLNRPVLDGTEIKLASTGGGFSSPTVLTRNGKARPIFTSDEKPHVVTVTATSSDVSSNCTIKFGVPDDALLMATLRDPRGNCVENADLFRGSKLVDASDSNGFIFDRVDNESKNDYKIVKKGYSSKSFSPPLTLGKLTVENLLLEPVDNGVFFHKRIILDPAGTSIKAMPIILELRQRIENAGGNAILTWGKPPAPSLEKRVARAGEENADIYLAIDIKGDAVSAGYYFKSDRGKELALLLCEQLTKDEVFIKKKQCGIITSTHYVIIQTAMPSVWLSLPDSSDEDAGKVAAGIYKALLEMFSKQ
jgi:N-acetylmuramoyl-L-alanine amidase